MLWYCSKATIRTEYSQIWRSLYFS